MHTAKTLLTHFRASIVVGGSGRACRRLLNFSPHPPRTTHQSNGVQARESKTRMLHRSRAGKSKNKMRSLAIAPATTPLSETASDTAMYVSTFQAKRGSEHLLLHELQRLVSYTRRESACVFCDLFRTSVDKSVFVVHSVWMSPQAWLTRSGWEGHPAGMGLLDQWLRKPVEVVSLEEVA